LSDIGTAVEAGGFVGYRFGGDRAGQGAVTTELSVVHDISGTYDGFVVTAGAGYTALRTRETFVSMNVQTNWADGDYTRTYFGITPEDAARSGLSASRPGSGFRDVGAGVTAGYAFNRRLGATARLGANYLVGDAADSPIIDSGSRWQPSGGLALSWRF
jgi:MipA family protein